MEQYAFYHTHPTPFLWVYLSQPSLLPLLVQIQHTHWASFSNKVWYICNKNEIVYKYKLPNPTIARLFNTYHFAPYKEQVTDLLRRVCTVSLKTMSIIAQMPPENA